MKTDGQDWFYKEISFIQGKMLKQLKGYFLKNTKFLSYRIVIKTFNKHKIKRPHNIKQPIFCILSFIFHNIDGTK